MKGQQVEMFKVGDFVEYQTCMMKVKGEKPIHETRTGRIVKLHSSGSQGVAMIKPSDGSKKISRRLQHVTKKEVK